LWAVIILLGIIAPLIAYAKTNQQNQKLVEAKTSYGRRVLQSGKDLRPYKPSSIYWKTSKAKPKTKTQDIAKYSGRHYTPAEVVEIIKQYAQQYGIAAEAPLCIAKKESGYNQFSANKRSSARGVFQYLSGTWRATDEGKAGLSVYDAESNIKAAIKYMASRKNAKPWTVAKQCQPITPIN
jgi:hypothetical protein